MGSVIDAGKLSAEVERGEMAYDPEGFRAPPSRNPYVAGFLAGASAPIDLLSGLTSDVDVWSRTVDDGFARDRFALGGYFWRALTDYRRLMFAVHPRQERLFDLEDLGDG
jgi:hypothetical protein